MSRARCAIAVAGSLVLAGCSASNPNVVSVLETDDPARPLVIVDTCNKNPDLTVTETAERVEISVSRVRDDSALTGGDDCQDAVEIQLDAPLGNRTIVRSDGSEVSVERKTAG